MINFPEWSNWPSIPDKLTQKIKKTGPDHILADLENH
jgi:hypothetical protein